MNADHNLKRNQKIKNNLRPLGLGGRIGLTIFFLLFFGMGTLFTIMMIKFGIDSILTRSWTQTTATIISSEIIEETNYETPYLFSILYEYDFAGQKFKSSKLYQNSVLRFSSYYKAQKLLEKYKPGSSKTCWVNPKNPSEAILEHESLMAFFLIPLPLIFVFIGIIGIYGVWFFKKDHELMLMKRITPAAPFIKKTAFILFGLIFFAVGLIASYHLTYKSITKILSAKSWLTVPCKIISGRVLTHDSDDGHTYSIDILYEYELNGTTYRSNTYDLIGGSSSGYQSKKDIVDRYLSLKETQCFVNPADPSEAVLQRDISPKILLTMIPIVFLIVGLGLTYAGIRTAFTHSLQPNLYPKEQEYYKNYHTVETKAELKSTASPITKFLGILFVCLFWNGIVSIFLYQIISNIKAGRIDWFGIIFLIPFVAIGLAILFGVFHQFLAIFNPKIKLFLYPPLIYPGGQVEISWKILGNPSKIQSLSIILNGKEQIHISGGDGTTTKENVFFTKQIFSSQASSDAKDGVFKFSLPENIMHSFDAATCKIIWEIKVHGIIPSRPDIKDDYVIRVLPTKSFL